MEFKKGNKYSYEQIESCTESGQFEIQEHGSNNIGKNFLVLEHEVYDQAASFVLEGATGKEYIYECVYSDIIPD